MLILYDVYLCDFVIMNTVPYIS